MPADRQQLESLALICSRICHDLAGSIGAVSNGAELLAEETDAAIREEAIRLIAQAANDAARRLAFFRLALGASGGLDDAMAGADLQRVAADYFAGGRVALRIATLPVSLPKAMGKALLLGLSIGALALPRGGEVELRLDGAAFRIRASGTHVRANETLALLNSDAPLTEPVAAMARHCRELAGLAGRNVTAEAGADGVMLVFAA